jgi:small subunit ribosomal protein S21
MTVQVTVRNDVDRSLKKLKRLMERENILAEVKERKYYMKPSVKKRKKAARARARLKKEERMADKGFM